MADTWPISNEFSLKDASQYSAILYTVLGRCRASRGLELIAFNF